MKQDFSGRFMVRIADRYILGELLGPFLLGVGGFIVILVGDILYTLAEFLISARISMAVLVKLLAYKLPAILVVTFPVATLFAILLGLGRMERDRELRAMRLAGVSLARLFLPVFLFGVAMAVTAFATNEFLAPWANQEANAILHRAAFGEGAPRVREQVFFRGPGNRVFYVEQVDHDRRLLRNVMVYEVETPLPRVITAREATQNPNGWQLRNGVVRELDEEGFTRFESRFDVLEIAVNPAEASVGEERSPDEMTARELWRYLTLFEHGLLSSRFVMEFHRKFAIPLASAVFALVAAPLSLYAAQGRVLGVGLNILILFIYYAVMSMGRALGAAGVISPTVAAWTPNLLFGLGGVVMWFLSDRAFLPRLVRVQAAPGQPG